MPLAAWTPQPILPSPSTIPGLQAGLVRELCTRGHRRIAALIVEKDDHSIGELRFRGYKAALQEQGIPYDPDLVECVHDFNMESAYQGTQRLIDRAGDFTALFALSDLMGMAAIKALYQRGKRVPADCSVIAIDGWRFPNIPSPP